MNLRQKIKHAKKELKALEKQRKNSLLDVSVFWFEQRTGFQSIISKKRKQHRYSSDDSILKAKKRTYIALTCGVTKLFVLENQNGKPLSKKQLSQFGEKAMEALFRHKRVIYNRYKDDEKVDDDFYVIYSVDVSVDSSKKKNLVSTEYFYQFKGNENIYQMKDGKYVLVGA